MSPDPGNDRDTAVADRDATHEAAPLPLPLPVALDRLALDGALFFRSEFSEGWSYESPVVEGAMAESLRPGSERLVIFHIVASGRCWVSLLDGERHWADEGDVIVIPYGDAHRMGGESPATTVPFVSLIDPPPWDTLPVLRHGEGGRRTDVVCGYLHSVDPLFDPRLRALSPLFVVRPPDGPAARWVRSSIEYALERSAAPPPEGATDTRLSELLFVEVLRLHLASAPAADRGWVSALRDPVLAPALALLHADPARKWTVPDLAAEAATSRSLLDERFRQVLGRSPIRYLTDWRMHLAVELLGSADLNVAQIARRVGYESEEAFSRAFKRELGIAPSLYRLRRRTAGVTA
jgi:AraC-like DNA-binding protein